MISSSTCPLTLMLALYAICGMECLICLTGCLYGNIQQLKQQKQSLRALYPCSQADFRPAAFKQMHCAPCTIKTWLSISLCPQADALCTMHNQDQAQHQSLSIPSTWRAIACAALTSFMADMAHPATMGTKLSHTYKGYAWPRSGPERATLNACMHARKQGGMGDAMMQEEKKENNARGVAG